MKKKILIECIPISRRCLNILKSSNINTLDELINSTGNLHYQMEKYRNLGLIALNEIDLIVELYGYHIQNFLSVVPDDISEAKKRILNEFYIQKNVYMIEKICFKYGNGYLFYSEFVLKINFLNELLKNGFKILNTKSL